VADVAVRELRSWQVEAIDNLRGSLRRGHKRPILQAPTGVGKTALSAAVIRLALDKGKRAVFSVPAISLIDQTIQSFWRDGIRDVGVMQQSHHLTDPSKPVQVCSVQTLARRADPETDLVIVDEAHLRSKHIEAWMTRTKAPFIGLSATPWTRGLGSHFDDLVVAMTTRQAIDEKLLTPFRVFGPDSPDTTGIKVTAGDYQIDQASKRMQEKRLVANIAETWLEKGKGLATLCFCVDRAHAKKVQQEFLDAGVLAAYQDAFTPADERRDIKEKFHRGAYPVVCSVGTLILGVDWDVRCIIWARLTKSPILFCQGIGRGLRLAEGKDSLLILDHAGTHDKLGFVDEIHRDHLHDGKTSEAEAKTGPLPKKCPQCSFIRPPKISKCPNCGFQATAPTSTIETVEGSLVEKQSKYTSVQKLRQKTKQIVLNTAHISLRDFYAQLQGYAEAHNYKPGWASNQFKAAVGVWPNSYRDAIARPPNPEVTSYIRSRQIAYAKSKDRR
jgi:DNA repair protein RadD